LSVIRAATSFTLLWVSGFDRRIVRHGCRDKAEKDKELCGELHGAWLKRVQEDSGLAHEVDLGGPYKMQAFTPLIASKNQNTRPLGLELKEVKKLLLM
jgi:hypothetical protein